MSSAQGVRLRVREVSLRVRPAQMRIPFHFGDMQLTACPQVFARVHIETEQGVRASGVSAELMVPRWFDKRKTRSAADNVSDLQASLEAAASAYLSHGRLDTPFALFESSYGALISLHTQAGRTGLSGAYGQAVLDRAVIDAACRATRTSFFQLAGRNGLGLRDSPLAEDLKGFSWDAWLSGRQPLRAIDVRHTVGLHDALEERRHGEDGLPSSLASAIERYGLRYFKVKIGGDVQRDLERVVAVVDLLKQLSPRYRLTLDGNEQYQSAADLRALVQGLSRLDIADRLLYLEQPLSRDQSFDEPLPSSELPFLMDEADDSISAFVRGQRVGWRGVSAKGCKGIYKSFINAARCAASEGAGWGPFMSAEDLSCQAGVSVQQDLSIAAFLGLSHAERNGHHFGRGLAGMPSKERDALLTHHGDLYAPAPAPHLNIAQGVLPLGSLDAVGFGAQVDIAFEDMLPLAAAPALL